ncbi:membrane assembly protein AsmA [Aureimonas sp. SA4125]|uniref:AsmA family protein n=1 Tax=Aureimonas sp. SA4125 TaxID=2826993 RepID=UPI001CC8286B|nr:AsmA-like C-terminal region-containing protein [Aureimonas sp. SA4125]BDA83549.1 membrane assembly protein AsmA [Aureimonas sp. SA4125]
MTRIEKRSARSPRQSGLRHWGLRQWSGVSAIVVALVAATLATFAILSGLSLQAGAARADIERQLSDLAGLPVSVEGSSSLSLLPKTQIRLSRVRVGEEMAGARPMATVDAIIADLGLWDALFGRAEIERLTVIRPRLLAGALTDPAQAAIAPAAPAKTGRSGAPEMPAQEAPSGLGSSRDSRDFRQISHYLAAFLTRLGDLTRVDISNGAVRAAPGDNARGITDANITVSWPSPGAAAVLTGSYVWNGEPADINLKLSSPLEFLEGGPSAIDLTLTSPPLDIRFSGTGSTRGNSDFAGAVKISTPSLARSVRWLGDPNATMPDLGTMAIEAALESTGMKLNLRDATVSIVGYSGTGAMEMAMGADSVPAVSGTLAFDQLDLTAFAQALAPLPRNPLEFERRIATGFIHRLDLDLRISAAEGAIATVPITDLAATVKFKDGVAMFDVGDASMLGGQGQGRFAVDSRARIPLAKGSASVSGIDTAQLLAAIGVSAVGVSGLSDLHAEVGMPVTSWADIARRLQLTLAVTARDGSLSGFDPAVFLGAGTKPFALATGASAIPFKKLQAKLSSTGPSVAIQKLSLDGAAGTFEAAGALSTATNGIDVFGSFTPLSTATATPLANSQPVSFRMSGEWPRPTVTTGPPVAPM